MTNYDNYTLFLDGTESLVVQEALELLLEIYRAETPLSPREQDDIEQDITWLVTALEELEGTVNSELILGYTENHIVEKSLRLLRAKIWRHGRPPLSKQGKMVPDFPPNDICDRIIPHILDTLKNSSVMTGTTSRRRRIPSYKDYISDPKPEPDNGAEFSECGTYRYKLWRIWDDKLPPITFIGLNPSTADAIADDQTVTRCIRFSKDWGYGGFQIVNLFAYRSTDPDALKHVADPVGPENDRYIKDATGLDHALVVAVWGKDGGKTRRSGEVLQLINRGLDCLGYTKDGYPKHPSRARKDSELERFPRSLAQ